MGQAKKTLANLITLLADNVVGDASAEDVRNFLVSVYGSWHSKVIINTYSILSGDVALQIDATAGAITATLPTGSDEDHKIIYVTRKDNTSNSITINCGGFDTFQNGNTSKLLLSQFYGILLIKIGTVWKTVSENPLNSLPVQTLKWYDNGTHGINFGDMEKQGLSANTLIAVRVVITQTLTLNALGVILDNANGNEARIGVYTDKDNRPDRLVIETLAITIDSAGAKQQSVSQELHPGTYWLALVNDQLADFSSYRNIITSLEYANNGDIIPYTYVQKLHTFGALPDPFGTATMTQGEAIRILFQVA